MTLTRKACYSDSTRMTRTHHCLIHKLRSFAHKELSYFFFSDDQYWCKFSVFAVPAGSVMILFKNQVFHLIRNNS